MNCPDCNTESTSIRDTRRTEDGDVVRRRRECSQCGFRFTTYERKDWDTLRVKKSDGTTEPYDKAKIRQGVELAVEKRPVSNMEVTELVDDVTTQVKDEHTEVVSSDSIGAAVVDRLRDLDGVAYIRFISVYNGYSDPEEFSDVLDRIRSDAASESESPTTDTTSQ